jgi:tRNA (guanine37-N1)-methyltransferase
MIFTVLTIFPEMVTPFLEHGIVRRAIEQKKISASSINIRDFAEGKHKVTDDRPFGGGCGMLMKPEPLAKAIAQAKKKTPGSKTVLLSPQGRTFNKDVAREFASRKGLLLVCGRYEGVDERICESLIDDEISVGDYVLTGGELAAMIIIDAVTRLLPDVLGCESSACEDSFESGLLKHAQYTRPRIFNGNEVPEVLLSGDHTKTEKWRFESSIMRTFIKRPDLLQKRPLTNREIEILKEWGHRIKEILYA